jgi:hypothetical protein
MRKCRLRSLYERYGFSFSIREMASVKSLVRGVPHLGASHNEVLLSAQRLRHFFIVEVASASVSWMELSMAAIAEAHRPLSVRKRMTARCFLKILNVQTGIDVLKTSAEAEVVGAMKIVEREIGAEEIVCRIRSFSMIGAYHWVR